MRISNVIHKQRRCGSMKRMLFLGALVLGVTACTQSFGFEILHRMVGHHKGCADSCCEPGCAADSCEPACGAKACCEPACGADGCCEPACGADSCCSKGHRKCDLFGGIKGLFHHAKGKLHALKHHSSCSTCCEPACGAEGCCEPACGAEGCCEPACGADSCCSKGCGKKHCTPILDLLRAIHHAKKSHGCTSCCEPACGAGGCCEPGCGAEPGCGCEPACGADPACSAGVAKPTPDMAAKKQANGRVIAVSRKASATK